MFLVLSPANPCSEDDSPYPEVRSAVANTDDPDIPVSTIRSWVLGVMWAIIIPVMQIGLSMVDILTSLL